MRPKHHLATLAFVVASFFATLACTEGDFAGSSGKAGGKKSADGGKGSGGKNTTIPVGQSDKISDVLSPKIDVVDCKSENVKIAKCNPKTGEIDGVAPGTTIIRVKTPTGEEEITVTVTPKGGGIGSGSDDGSGKPGGSGGSGSGSIGDDSDTAGGSGSGSGSIATDTGTKIKPDPGGLLVDEGGTPCIDKVLPLHIVFALDVTGSMDSNIEAVRSNVVAFSQQMQNFVPDGGKEKIPNVKIGLVTFVDDVADQQSVPLTDPAALAAQMAGIETRGGINDHCEGGIAGAEAAVNMLTAASSEESVPILVVITDNYAHDAKNPDGARTFDTSALQQAVQTPGLKNLIFFDSAPTSSNVPGFTACPTVNFGSPPSAQWDPIRTAWSQAHPTAKTTPGRNVSFPFTSSTISTVLPAEIGKLIKICK